LKRSIARLNQAFGPANQSMAKRNAKHAIKALTLATLKTTGFEFRFENSKLKQFIQTKKEKFKE
jgi:hypothetical protein